MALGDQIRLSWRLCLLLLAGAAAQKADLQTENLLQEAQEIELQFPSFQEDDDKDDQATNAAPVPQHTPQEMQQFANCVNLRTDIRGTAQPQQGLVVLAMFKNEAGIFKEWLDHYISQGVDFFYLVDNGSTDNYMQIVQQYVGQGKAQVFNLPQPHMQGPHYNRVLPQIKAKAQWVLTVDMDEFMYAGNGFLNIKAYLNTMPQNIQQVVVPWKVFGSSGLVQQPTSVRKGFTKRKVTGPQWPLYKSICRVQNMKWAGIHHCYFQDANNVQSVMPTNPPTNLNAAAFWPGLDMNHPSQQSAATVGNSNQIAGCLAMHLNGFRNTAVLPPLNDAMIGGMALQLNHYQTQSQEWYTKVKGARGDVLSATNDHIWGLDRLRETDSVCTVEDTQLSSQMP